MNHRFVGSIMAAALSANAASALAQPAAPAPQPPFEVPNPHYVVIELEQDIDRPAGDVWAKVGKFCDIAVWLRSSCTIIAGNEPDLGATRRVNGSGRPGAGGAIEILVAKTQYSYTYSQPARVGVPYNEYHGTMEARPVTAATSKLVYSLIYDNSTMADDAARAADLKTRTARFVQALKDIKVLAETGAMPPPPPKP
jgi:hypothetical protein